MQNVPEEILVVGDKIAVFLHFQAWPKGGGEPREGHIADVYKGVVLKGMHFTLTGEVGNTA